MKQRDWLATAALLAAIAVTSSAEYSIARACGYGTWVAGAFPAAFDIYAVRALRAHRDVLAVVVAMIAVNALSHLVAAGMITVSVPLVIAVSAVAPLVLWRVHALREVAGQAAVRNFTAEPAAEPAPMRDHFTEPRPVIKVPVIVPDILDGKGYKQPLPALPPGPEPGPLAVDLLARQHKVRPDQIRTVLDLLDKDADLTGSAAGAAVGAGDRYGRRVLAAAKELQGVRP